MQKKSILKIKLPIHEVEVDMPEGVPAKDQLLSVLFAVLEGASNALDISRNDINGCIGEDNELILFDDTAGGSGFVKQIFSHFEEVLKAARNKVSGICGCTEETSCYGCLRNYSNQYYHDDISRGMALKYIDWLLNEAVANKPPVSAPVAPAVTAEESIGLKKSFYEAPDTSTLPDTESQLKSMLLAANDESVIAGISKLLDYVGSKNYEHPLIDEPIWLDDTVWPDIIWGKAHVAVFSPAKIKQYKLLKKYDWYCYILDENIDAELLFSHIKELVELVLKYYGQLSEKYRKMIPLKMVYIPVTLDTELKLNDYPL